jgi:hypothetical protein
VEVLPKNELLAITVASINTARRALRTKRWS